MSHPDPTRTYEEDEERFNKVHNVAKHMIKGPKKFPKLKMGEHFGKLASNFKKATEDKTDYWKVFKKQHKMK